MVTIDEIEENNEANLAIDYLDDFNSDNPAEKATKDPRAIARRYQLELCEKAKEENIIVYLETGMGKTLIAILLMVELAERVKKPGKNVFVFLAPTVPLVEQQADVIRKYTYFKVGKYYGEAKHSSHAHQSWMEELENHEVLVMTPDILLHNLHHCFMKMELIEVLIFDECHHAQKRHSYAQVMKEFFKKDSEKRPRIFGMTASPIMGKGGSNQLEYAKGINTLEQLLEAKVYTVGDRSEIESFVPSPEMMVCYYDNKSHMDGGPITSCRDKLDKYRTQHISQVFSCCTGENVEINKHDFNGTGKKTRSISKSYLEVMYCLSEIGLWGAKQAVKILLLETADNANANEDDIDSDTRKSFLRDTFSIFDSVLIEDGAKDDKLIAADSLVEPFFSSKVLALLEILIQYRNKKNVKCIIFVKRIIAARLLVQIINHVEVLDVWQSDFLVGHHSGLKAMSRAKMNNIVDDFRSGKINILVATNVAEEGLDIQTCSLVIRFDLPDTVASFIQSRGRARMLESEYIFLVERGNFAEEKLVKHFVTGEEQMTREVLDRTPEGADPYEDEEDQIYKVDSTKATISTGCSVSLLYHYCSKLSKDEFFCPVPEFSNFEEPGGVKCCISLPSNAPFRQVEGPICSSVEKGKRVACLEACKLLHSIGALNDYLLPAEDEQDEGSEDCPRSDSRKTKGAEMGMELYEMLVPVALKGGLNECTKPVCLNAYLLKFNPIPPDREYTQFALFIESTLPMQAATMKIELHLAHGRIVNTELIPCRSLEFDPIQLAEALKFQEIYLRIILDRADFENDYVEVGREDRNQGNPSTSYLLLPVQSCDAKKDITIEWKIIKDILSSPVFSLTSQKMPENFGEGHLLEMRDYLRLANGWVPMQTLKNSLVLTTHDNTFYCIVDILHQMNSNSKFGISSEYNYAEYFQKKHKVTLKYKDQPLLKAKQLFNLRNLLHARSQVNIQGQINRGDGTLEEKFVELPPELCIMKLVGFSKYLASSISLLPSMMHRLENFLVAIELKELLAASFPEGNQLCTSRVLEAITTERCMEGFSLERLEVLGDAFLKYSVSRRLFLVHDKLGEGQLTKKRSNAIKNLNLIKRAKVKGFQAYIRDEYFDPKHFFALGRPCKENCTPENVNEIHYYEGNIMKEKVDGVIVKCSKRHHWMHMKTIADVVEALIGAYLVESGFKAALSFLKWIGIEIDFDPLLIEDACIQSRNNLSLIDYINISNLEGLIGHKFLHKGLLLEAFTHPSYNEHNGGCYQRLEFLGDAVLDYIITSYLYSVYPDMGPGRLTDMRSMTVNNESFANVAVRKDLYTYLIQKSDSLSSAIDKYVCFINTHVNKDSYDEVEPKCPKVLGDLVESFAGALLIDTGFDLEYVWKLMLKILEPIVTPETLRLQPVRELLEICQHHELKCKDQIERKGNEYLFQYLVQLKVNGKEVMVYGSASRPNKNVAKKFAAQVAIRKLKAYNLEHPNKSLEVFFRTCKKNNAVLIGNDKTYRPGLEIMFSGKHQALNPSISKSSFSNTSEKKRMFSKDPVEINMDAVPSVQESTLTKHGNHQPFSDILSENRTSSTIQNIECKQDTLTYSSTAQATTSEDEQPDCHQCIESDVKSSGYQSPSANYSTGNSQYLGSAISNLNEFCQKQRWESPLWVCCKEDGLPHQRSFTYMVVLRLPGNVSVECLGEAMRSKKLAMGSAACASTSSNLR
ncbi:hypothetical protein SUGI_0892520 [Cryptomeria japonica]|nr:hypothetical protein SUGI_0892520 [Cryptomeria japonica]